MTSRSRTSARYPKEHPTLVSTATPDTITVPAVPLPADAAPGIYVHVPFCRRICPYCDFNTYAGKDALLPTYVEAVLREIELTARTHAPKAAPTLFFGGGTPSLLAPEQVARIVDAARQRLGLREDAEVTLEANPEGLDDSLLRELRAAGVNRLSLGVQSQQHAGLRVLGRGHTAEKASIAFSAARAAGFDNISLDLIFGWPGQTAADWEADLATLLAWSPEHVSLYSLIVEPGTPMHEAVRRGILTPVDDDTTADMYERAIAVLGNAGWEHYEIANWARQPRYRSRHNQLYWQNGPYFGIGAGAYGTLAGTRASNHLLPARYIAALQAGESPRAVTESISPETAIGETMMLGLRLLVDGVSATDFQMRHHVDLREHYATQIARFTNIGLLEWSGPGADRLRLTQRGGLLANEVCAAFLPGST
jgi:oxygen-independent coproporphyrinogen III oxidase